MRTEAITRTIAVLGVDGENFEVDGHFEGQERKARWYSVKQLSDGRTFVDHLPTFPSHDEIRKMVN
ncbi:hypothetical protein [Amphritea balenae]|uniref:Uncharacterized protein n=1 Tax=Amphritea balenae TaxID=452629 RepID=A0A3P1SSF7_9GAMM|nr:hypothetical protein [Amphritea balenae]RRD00061.1 hypothetical protein EHS89_07575 [Amphritea balenae]GGK76213.1 hypothetical protein GCM10007941_28040 [Amphritea balenae]